MVLMLTVSVITVNLLHLLNDRLHPHLVSLLDESPLPPSRVHALLLFAVLLLVDSTPMHPTALVIIMGLRGRVRVLTDTPVLRDEGCVVLRILLFYRMTSHGIHDELELVGSPLIQPLPLLNHLRTQL